MRFFFSGRRLVVWHRMLEATQLEHGDLRSHLICTTQYARQSEQNTRDRREKREGLETFRARQVSHCSESTSSEYHCCCLSARMNLLLAPRGTTTLARPDRRPWPGASWEMSSSSVTFLAAAAVAVVVCTRTEEVSCGVRGLHPFVGGFA